MVENRLHPYPEGITMRQGYIIILHFHTGRCPVLLYQSLSGKAIQPLPALLPACRRQAAGETAGRLSGLCLFPASTPHFVRGYSLLFCFAELFKVYKYTFLDFKRTHKWFSSFQPHRVEQ